MSGYPGDEYFASIQNQITRSKVEFRSDIHKLLEQTARFAEDLTNAIGEISISEAKLALVAFFTEKIK